METAETFYHILCYVLGIAFFATLIIGYSLRFFRDFCSREISVEATVADFYETHDTSVGTRTGARFITRYTAVFLTKDRPLRFSVSPWVYGSLFRQQKGILYYRGSRFIRFEQR